MLHFETIEPATLGLLKQLLALPELSGCRLVGGTALALQLGHRTSIDLDLFGNVTVAPEELIDALSIIGTLETRKNSGNIHLFSLNGIKVDIVNFPFPWRQAPITDEGLRIAGLEDIAAMKVTAAIGRGTKKDFLDIATLLQYYSLPEILSFYESKYPNSSLFMAIKSLGYFEDAEADVMPKMFSSLTWPQAKDYIRKAIEQL